MTGRRWLPLDAEDRVERLNRVGMPNGLVLPFGLGMYTRRTAFGRYSFFLSSSASSPSHSSIPYASMASKL